MNISRKKFILAATGAFILLLIGCTRPIENTTSDKPEKKEIYTCPMHPHIRETKPGKCPICGMDLVKIDESDKAFSKETEVHVTSSQLALASISKYIVTQKDLDFSTPVSGRFISGSQIAFQIFESDLQIVKIGSSFKGFASSSPEAEISGTIQSIDHLADPNSRSIRVTGILKQAPKYVILEGSFSGEIITTVKNQLFVPEEAVYHAGTKDLVYKFTNDASSLKPQKIVLGRKTQNEYQILSGLNIGDSISSGPNFLIDSEAKIRGIND